MNRLEDDIRAVLRSQADAMQVPEPHAGSTTVTLIDTGRTPTQPERRHRWPFIAVAAAAIVAIAVGAVMLAARDDSSDQTPAGPPTTVVQPTTVAQPAAIAQPPVEFTACVLNGPAVTPGTEERTAVSLPDGEMTIIREHGVWQLNVNQVSDPRLRGTWTLTADFDHYMLPRSAEIEIVSGTYRIENDDGAWQGSDAFLRSDDEFWAFALIGEGAYEGLTAIMNVHQDQASCPNTRGFIFEGSIPTPPVPYTG